MTDECDCRFSERLCPVHGTVSDLVRDEMRQDAYAGYNYFEEIGLFGTIDAEANRHLISYLRTDAALPYPMREFLANALEGRDENWRLIWKGSKQGPQYTPAVREEEESRAQKTSVAAMDALASIKNGVKVEAAIADIMQSASVSRSTAYVALKLARKLDGKVMTLGEYEQSIEDRITKPSE